MKKNMDQREIQKQLHQEALLLRERVIAYYRSHGDPDPYSGLATLLQHVAEKLAQEPTDAQWLKNNIWGIYRVVSDSCMEKTILGEDLYNFKDRVRKFATTVFEQKNMIT